MNLQQYLQLHHPEKSALELWKQFAGVMIADTAIDFMIQSPQKYDNFLSNRFHNVLLFEIEQRRTELSDIILYLHMVN